MLNYDTGISLFGPQPHTSLVMKWVFSFAAMCWGCASVWRSCRLLEGKCDLVESGSRPPVADRFKGPTSDHNVTPPVAAPHTQAAASEGAVPCRRATKHLSLSWSAGAVGTNQPQSSNHPHISGPGHLSTLLSVLNPFVFLWRESWNLLGLFFSSSLVERCLFFSFFKSRCQRAESRLSEKHEVDLRVEEGGQWDEDVRRKGLVCRPPLFGYCCYFLCVSF